MRNSDGLATLLAQPAWGEIGRWCSTRVDLPMMMGGLLSAQWPAMRRVSVITGEAATNLPTFANAAAR